jgi:hypothetical protein
MFSIQFRLTNEAQTCYLSSMIQCFSGLKDFCGNAKTEARSPLLLTFRAIVEARDEGHAERMAEARTDFRLMAGSLLRAEFLDERLQQDAQELIVLFLQRVHLDSTGPKPSIVNDNFATLVRIKQECRYGYCDQIFKFTINKCSTRSCSFASSSDEPPAWYQYLYVRQEYPVLSVKAMLAESMQHEIRACGVCGEETRRVQKTIVKAPR